MDKILITDLHNTLMPTDEKIIRTMYGSSSKEYYLSKMFNSLKNELEPFLNNDNEIIIVSNIHRFYLINLIQDLKEVNDFFKEHENQISFYLCGELEKEDIFDLNGMISNHDTKIIFKDMKPINILPTKQDVFEFVNKKATIYCIGNAANDIEMLKEAIKLPNSNASLINYNLLDPYYINQDGFITKLVNDRFNYLIEAEVSQHQLSQVAKVQMKKRLWLNLKEEMETYKNRLQFQVNNKLITYIDIIKESYIREKIYKHYQYNKNYKPSIEEIDALVSQIQVYNSFYEYSNLVLKKNT